MKHLFYCLLFLGLASCSCSSESDSGSADMETSSHAPVEKRDSAAYRLGEAHARRMLENATDTAAMGDALLDVRSRETDIRRRLRPSAADAYVAGFTDAVVRLNPALAEEIF